MPVILERGTRNFKKCRDRSKIYEYQLEQVIAIATTTPTARIPRNRKQFIENTETKTIL